MFIVRQTSSNAVPVDVPTVPLLTVPLQRLGIVLFINDPIVDCSVIRPLFRDYPGRPVLLGDFVDIVIIDYASVLL